MDHQRDHKGGTTSEEKDVKKGQEAKVVLAGDLAYGCAERGKFHPLILKER